MIIEELDPQVCKMRYLKSKLEKHIKSTEYGVNGIIINDSERNNYELFSYNTLCKRCKGVWGKLRCIYTIFHFSFHEKTCTVIIHTVNKENHAMICEIAEKVFNVEGVKVVIKKDFC